MSSVEHLEIERADPGNTEISGSAKRQGLQALYYCFTLNNYEVEHLETLFALLKSECEWFIFQEETGQKGTPHIQGTLKLKKRQRITQLKHINPKIHWEKTKNVKAAVAYCLKEETRTGAQWIHGINIPKPPRVHEPYGWQLQIMEIIAQEPDERTIHWVYDPVGNMGKSQLCKYLVVKHNALVLTGKSSDMFHLLAKFPHKRTIILVDVPRHGFNYINYTALEMIKNGLVCSGKYEGAQLVFDCPHVIVFANELPDTRAYSQDRLHIIKI